MQEAKLNIDNTEGFLKYCRDWEGVFQEANGIAGGLGILWKRDSVKVNLSEKAENWMICNVYSMRENLDFPSINVYGPSNTAEKTKLWNILTNKIKDLGRDRVVVARDFNTLLDLDEKKGGLRMTNKVMDDFREFVVRNHLVDVIAKNGQYTWTNRRVNFANISERLDRHFIGEYWMESSFQTEACILLVSLSDHFLVELKLSEGKPKGLSSFKFLSMWWRDGEFSPNLGRWWKESNIFRGTPSFCFVKRMKFLKEKIKRWNRECFKNIFEEKIQIEEALLQINSDTILRGMTNDTFRREKALKEELAKVLLREEIFWRDKSKELWIKEGDANTKFFHASVKTKRGKNRIDTVMDQNGTFHSSFEAIEQLAVNNFKILLRNDNGGKNI
ncbi:uncharacterized protein LOC131077334 [Cryptomeria japonica]|uniref:uncharacterized protein LOC131077334 n=1 Tax=Cryptomeria japonica TaxID=3369 RepID=UPI0027DA9C83|nr:uncharacterized protein LOC131077334 [Cryptomeria japonica]